VNNHFRNIVLILAFLVILFAGAPVLFDHLMKPAKCRCCVVEADAQNTLAAIASYFADPENEELPALVVNEDSTVTIERPVDNIMVTVINNEIECPRGNAYAVVMGGGEGTWYSE
jgi:hypothetical protein